MWPPSFDSPFWVVPFVKTSMARAIGPRVITSSTHFSFQNLVFFGVCLNFSAAEIT
jgi:hypothetical protein